ncbi:MAG: response regulator [Candidatus Moraniibacteriota bacterium]
MKILYIDDSVKWRSHFKELLEMVGGYAVEVASSGEEGINKIKLGGYDLVITDTQMGTISGLDVIRFVNSNYPNLKVILKSVMPFQEEAEKEGVLFYSLAMGLKSLLEMISSL